MPTAIEQRSMTLSDPASLEIENLELVPEWLRTVRENAASRFRARGLPTTRDEEWRYTSLKALAGIEFATASDRRSAITPEQVESRRFPGLGGSCFVFVNGLYAPDLSSTAALPAGVTVRTFGKAFERHPDLLKRHLTRYADDEADALTALNTANLTDGVVVDVPKNTSLADPIHVLSITTAPDQATMTHPRHLIVAEEGAEATVIEEYVSFADDIYLTNAVTEIVVGANANVHHYMIEDESPRAFNISTLRVQQERDSRFASHSVLLGGALVRNNVNPVLNGEGCDSLLNGLYIGREKQHFDNHMRVEHIKGRCESRQYYRGILDDDSHGVFSGRIVVVQDAQKTDAIQSNQNLLLSETARATTKPQLEIYADDVRCTHGATVGELDDDALFYLRSRGLKEVAARGMLVYAMADESLGRMELGPIRDRIRLQLLDHLAYGPQLKGLL